MQNKIDIDMIFWKFLTAFWISSVWYENYIQLKDSERVVDKKISLYSRARGIVAFDRTLVSSSEQFANIVYCI